MNKPYKKYFKFQQESGWCGPAVIQMALTAGGIKISQAKITKDVYFSWWGTTQDIMYAYLSRYFHQLGFKSNATLADIKKHLKNGEVVIVNWWDDLDPEDHEGHYSLIFEYLPETSEFVLGDPARGITKMKTGEFQKRWFDYLDMKFKTKIKGWVLWVNPTKITPTLSSQR